jgi:hypothetical protein
MLLVQGNTLEDTWENIGHEDRLSIVAEIARAISELNTMGIHAREVKRIFTQMLVDEDAVLKIIQDDDAFGGPSTGFLTDGRDLLVALSERWKLKEEFCSLESIHVNEGTLGHIKTITAAESSYRDLGRVLLSDTDVSEWSQDPVFCHNNLIPRNIMVRSFVDSADMTRYKLSGIINWKLAGFYPAAYQLSLQDTYVGVESRHLSFYLLLKERFAELVPRWPPQVMLSRAMELMWESRQRYLLEAGDIPAHVRKRFLEEANLVRDLDPFLVRKRRKGTNVEIDASTMQRLENEVVEEMTKRREAGDAFISQSAA